MQRAGKDIRRVNTQQTLPPVCLRGRMIRCMGVCYGLLEIAVSGSIVTTVGNVFAVSAAHFGSRTG